VADDERNVRAAFDDVLGALGHEVVTVHRADAALEQLRSGQIDLAILDIRMPGMSGLDALRQIKTEFPRLPVIVMTGHGTMETAIEATKLGAFEYQLKPIDPDQMLHTINRALDSARLMRQMVALGTEAPPASTEAIVGSSGVMQEIFKAIGRVSQTDATVLIRGESGTGKELVARAIYQHSLRSDRPLLVVNCVAIPETLLESELFGYERGAFTGAVGQRIGKFEQAHEGTLFLDEIGDIPLGIQAKILRVLQERTFQRLGGRETIHSDVRVVAATNRNLSKAIAEGSFRDDLFHRLNVFTIQLPGLRERREDIPELVNYFLERFAGELKVEKPLITDDAMALLTHHSWPGNVRELEHCIHRAMIFTRGYPIQAADLTPLIRESAERGAACALDDEVLQDLVRRYLISFQGASAHGDFLDKVERVLLTEALQKVKGNQTHAARLLGIPRPTLHAKMQKHHLHGEEGPRER
jgi:nitrogen regulation protein NR(I)